MPVQRPAFEAILNRVRAMTRNLKCVLILLFAAACADDAEDLNQELRLAQDLLAKRHLQPRARRPDGVPIL